MPRARINNSNLRLRALSLVTRGETWEEIALRAGYFKANGDSDTTKVRIALGCEARHDGTFQLEVGEAVALRLAEGVLWDPVDVNL